MVTAPPKPEDRALAMAEHILELAESDFDAAHKYVRAHVPGLHREAHGGPMIVIFDDQEPRHEAVISRWEGETRRTACVLTFLHNIHRRLDVKRVEFTPEFLADILRRVCHEPDRQSQDE